MPQREPLNCIIDPKLVLKARYVSSNSNDHYHRAISHSKFSCMLIKNTQSEPSKNSGWHLFFIFFFCLMVLLFKIPFLNDEKLNRQYISSITTIRMNLTLHGHCRFDFFGTTYINALTTEPVQVTHFLHLLTGFTLIWLVCEWSQEIG